MASTSNNTATSETKKDSLSVELTVEAVALDAIESAELTYDINTEEQQTAAKEADQLDGKQAKADIAAAAPRAKIAEELAILQEAAALKAKMESEDLKTRTKIAMENAKKEDRHVRDIIGGGTSVMQKLRQFTFRYPSHWPVRRVIVAAEDDAATFEADTVTIEALALFGLGAPDINLLKGLVPDFEPMDTTMEDVYQTVRWEWIRDLAETREKNRPVQDLDAPELQTKYKSDILDILNESGMPEVSFQHILNELLTKVPGATTGQVRLHAFRSLLLMSQDGTVSIDQSAENVDAEFMIKINR